MVKEIMTARQIISIIVLFIIGSSVIIVSSTHAKQDSWISIISAIALSIPFLLIYARIIKLYPGEGLYDIINKLFGKVISTIIIILMTWYAIHLGSLVLRNFSEYIQISSLVNTPQIIVMIMFIITIIYIAKSGAIVLGRWALVSLPLVLLLITFITVFSFSSAEIENIFPILEHSFAAITRDALENVAFPFTETVLLLPLACFFKKSDNPYKTYIYGLLIGGVILLIIFLQNLTVLGAEVMASSYFPRLMQARVIELGHSLTKIEGFVTISFILSGILKLTICLIAASMGIAKVFSIKNYKNMVIPAGLLILSLSAIIFTNTVEMLDFNHYYAAYAFPFQVIIPLLIWITAEIKKPLRQPKNA